MKNRPMRRKITATATATEATLSIDEALTRFLKHKEATARSRTTYTTYRNSLNVFSQWCEMALPIGLETPITHFKDEESIDDYLIYLDDERLVKQVTIVHHKTQLRAFLYWLMDVGILQSFTISVRQAQESVPKFYTDEEVELLTKRPLSKSFVDYRNYIIVLLMLATGNRRATICSYTLADVDLKNNTLFMNTTKSKKGQAIPIHENLRKPLRQYMRMYRTEDCTPDSPLFPNEYGEFLVPNSLTHSIAFYNKARGVSKTSLHMFRHTFARNWVRSGGDSLILQRMLGHSTLTMTEKYVRLFRDDLDDAVAAHAAIKAVKGTVDKPKREKMRTAGRRRKV